MGHHFPVYAAGYNLKGEAENTLPYREMPKRY
jgi:hypothetical protein